MKIIVDSREQRNMNILSYLNENGIPWTVRKLEFGDYSFEVKGISYEDKCCIERKQNLSELAGNFTKGRNRFDAEFCKGKAMGCRMLLLVEDGKAREKLKLRVQMDRAGIDEDTKFRKTWRSRFSGNSMVGSIKAFKDRYDLELVFCNKKSTGKQIVEIFKKYLEGEKDGICKP